MKSHLVKTALLALALPAAAFSQTTLAGWTFSQFIFAPGYPSVDGSTGDPASFAAATFRGSYDPVLSQVDGTITVQTSATGYVDTTFGSWSWSNFDFAGGVDVLADNDNNTQTTNHITLDGKRMSDTDSAGMFVTFVAKNTKWSVTVGDTAGYTNIAGANNDFTFAARGNGGVATVEWLFNGSVFATTQVAAGSFAAYGVDLPGEFYGSGTIEGRLTSGSLGTVSIDNAQVNGSAIPEPSSFAALAGLVGLGFAASRRRRAG